MTIAAIFDLDNTLVIGSTGSSVVRYMWQRGLLTRYVPPFHIAKLLLATAGYRFGWVDVTRFMQYSTAAVKGIPLAEMWTLVDEWFAVEVQNNIAPGARKRLQWHREQGHRIAICSASGQFSCLPVARYLKVPEEDVIYTRWHEANDRMAGTVQLPINYAAGKVYWLRQWAERNGVTLAESYFYSDHESDLPLFDLVAHPTAVNPYPKLEKIARERGWPVEKWY